jgi:hypothetical protein
VDLLRYPARDFREKRKGVVRAQAIQKLYAATNWEWGRGSTAHIPTADEILQTIEQSLATHCTTGGINAEDRPNGWAAFSLYEVVESYPLHPPILSMEF